MTIFNFTIPPEYYSYYVISAIIIAAVWCFFGYRVFRFALGIIGFILGAGAAGAIGYEFSEGNELIAIGAAALGGILGAGAMFVLYILGVFAIGAALGALLAVSAYTYLGQEAGFIAIIATAFVAGVIAMFLKRFMIILATSFTGAWAMVSGVTYFIKANFNPLDPTSVFDMGEDQVYRFLIVWFALFVAGFIIQYLNCPKEYILLEDEVEEGEKPAPVMEREEPLRHSPKHEPETEPEPEFELEPQDEISSEPETETGPGKPLSE